MKVDFPLELRGGCWPPGKAKVCGMCHGAIRNSVVYLNAGAIAEVTSKQAVLEAFWHCGIHTSDPTGRGNVDVAIVESLGADQFDLSFCSMDCLKDFFLAIVREIELRKKATGEKGDGEKGDKYN